MLTCVPRVRLWTYQALTVDNSADRTDGKERSSYGPLNPAGSGRQPSGVKQENRQRVARCNLRNRTSRRSRPCVGLERTGICTALWNGMANKGAWPAAVSYSARTIFLYHR